MIAACVKRRLGHEYGSIVRSIRRCDQFRQTFVQWFRATSRFNAAEVNTVRRRRKNRERRFLSNFVELGTSLLDDSEWFSGIIEYAEYASCRLARGKTIQV